MCVICDQPYKIVESINDAKIQRGYQLETSSSENLKIAFIYLFMTKPHSVIVAYKIIFWEP